MKKNDHNVAVNMEVQLGLTAIDGGIESALKEVLRAEGKAFIGHLRTFAPIVSAHPYCTRNSHATSCIERAR